MAKEKIKIDLSKFFKDMDKKTTKEFQDTLAYKVPNGREYQNDYGELDKEVSTTINAHRQRMTSSQRGPELKGDIYDLIFPSSDHYRYVYRKTEVSEKMRDFVIDSENDNLDNFVHTSEINPKYNKYNKDNKNDPQNLLYPGFRPPFQKHKNDTLSNKYIIGLAPQQPSKMTTIGELKGKTEAFYDMIMNENVNVILAAAKINILEKKDEIIEFTFDNKKYIAKNNKIIQAKDFYRNGTDKIAVNIAEIQISDKEDDIHRTIYQFYLDTEKTLNKSEPLISPGNLKSTIEIIKWIRDELKQKNIELSDKQSFGAFCTTGYDRSGISIVLMDLFDNIDYALEEIIKQNFNITFNELELNDCYNWLGVEARLIQSLTIPNVAYKSWSETIISTTSRKNILDSTKHGSRGNTTVETEKTESEIKAEISNIDKIMMESYIKPRLEELKNAALLKIQPEKKEKKKVVTTVTLPSLLVVENNVLQPNSNLGKKEPNNKLPVGIQDATTPTSSHLFSPNALEASIDTTINANGDNKKEEKIEEVKANPVSTQTEEQKNNIAKQFFQKLQNVLKISTEIDTELSNIGNPVLSEMEEKIKQTKNIVNQKLIEIMTYYMNNEVSIEAELSSSQIEEIQKSIKNLEKSIEVKADSFPLQPKEVKKHVQNLGEYENNEEIAQKKIKLFSKINLVNIAIIAPGIIGLTGFLFDASKNLLPIKCNTILNSCKPYFMITCSILISASVISFGIKFKSEKNNEANPTFIGKL